MRNKILIVLTLVIFASCSPPRRLARLHERFPPDTTTTIEYRDTTIWRDTTVFKYLPGETVTVNVPFDVPIDLPDTMIWAETSLAIALAYLDDNHLGLDLIQNDTILQWLLDSAIQMNIDSIFITKEIPYPVIEYIEPKPFYKNGFFILAGLLVLSLVLFFAFRK